MSDLIANLPPHIRAFVAVRIPPDVLDQLSAVQQQLKKEFRDVTWTRPEAMHLTLQFLGNIDSSQLHALTDALSVAAAAHSSFDVQLADLGSFNSRVLWIGVRQGADEIIALAQTVRRAVKNLGSHEEDRAFSAHATLGRFRQRGRGVEAGLKKISPPSFMPWRIDHVELIRSELSPKGSRYTTLGIFNLT